MTQTTARIKQKGKHFEIIVELEDAIKFKKGTSSWIQSGDDRIYSDIKKGNIASTNDLKEAFGTTDIADIVKKIVKDGEVLTTQDYREEEKDKKEKQVIDFLSKNSINPQTGKPHTPDRIKSALEEAHVNIKNAPIDSQINDILTQISKIIPIKIETKKIRIKIPAIHTGKAYSIISSYKEEENWMNDGSLEVIVSIPAGITMDFYDKLNSATKGSALTEEIKE
jgi:ribosome maturation protein SDO1